MLNFNIVPCPLASTHLASIGILANADTLTDEWTELVFRESGRFYIQGQVGSRLAVQARLTALWNVQLKILCISGLDSMFSSFVSWILNLLFFISTQCHTVIVGGNSFLFQNFFFWRYLSMYWYFEIVRSSIALLHFKCGGIFVMILESSTYSASIYCLSMCTFFSWVCACFAALVFSNVTANLNVVLAIIVSCNNCFLYVHADITVIFSVWGCSSLLYIEHCLTSHYRQPHRHIGRCHVHADVTVSYLNFQCLRLQFTVVYWALSCFALSATS